jgi:hypothetical protein
MISLDAIRFKFKIINVIADQACAGMVMGVQSAKQPDRHANLQCEAGRM